MGLYTIHRFEKMPDGEDEEGRKKHLWRPIDPKIWVPGQPSGRLKRIAQRISDSIAPSFFALTVVVAPLSVLISIAIIYPLVPGQFFGPALIGVWSVMIVAFVVMAEKTGYARNFENWNFPMKRIAVLPIAFLLVMSLIAILYALAHHILI